MNLKLREFLLFGKVGGLRLGASVAEVEHELGPPEGIGSPETCRHGKLLWSYADYVWQIGFEDRRVRWFGFNLINTTSPRLPAAWGGELLPVDDRTPMTRFLEWLSDHHISFCSARQLSEDVAVVPIGKATLGWFDTRSTLFEKALVDVWPPAFQELFHVAR